MKYDVVVAAYNGGRFIEEQIDSILHQTIKPANIFIRDDCSTDNTLEVLDKYQKYSNIHIFKGEKNLGYIKNFERLTAYVESELVFFSDQDDVWASKKAEIMLTEFSARADTLLAFSDAYVVDQHLNKTGFLWESVNFSSEQNSLIRALKGNYVTGATMLVSTQFLKKLVPFPQDLPHDYWIIVNALIDGHALPVNQQLIYYRQHDANVLGLGLRKKDYLMRLMRSPRSSTSRKRANIFKEKLILAKHIKKSHDLKNPAAVDYCSAVLAKSIVCRIGNEGPLSLSQFCLYMKISSIKSFLLDLYDYGFMRMK